MSPYATEQDMTLSSRSPVLRRVPGVPSVSRQSLLVRQLPQREARARGRDRTRGVDRDPAAVNVAIDCGPISNPMGCATRSRVACARAQAARLHLDYDMLAIGLASENPDGTMRRSGIGSIGAVR